MVDALLEAWRATGDRAIPQTKVVGHRWSARSSEVRDFLARNRVPYRWLLADEPEGAQLLAAAGLDGADAAGGDHRPGRDARRPHRRRAGRRRSGSRPRPPRRLLRPRRHRRRPGRPRRGGVRRVRGLRPCCRAARPPAGRPGRAPASRTTSASPTACPAPSSPTGPAGRPRSSAPRCSPPREVSARWRSTGSARTVRFADGREIGAHAVILATGVAYRQLRRRPGCRRACTGRGVFYGAARDRGRRVRRRGRLHRRRRQLGGPGGGVPLPHARSR